MWQDKVCVQLDIPHVPKDKLNPSSPVFLCPCLVPLTEANRTLAPSPWLPTCFLALQAEPHRKQLSLHQGLAVHIPNTYVGNDVFLEEGGAWGNSRASLVLLSPLRSAVRPLAPRPLPTHEMSALSYTAASFVHRNSAQATNHCCHQPTFTPPFETPFIPTD